MKAQAQDDSGRKPLLFYSKLLVLKTLVNWLCFPCLLATEAKHRISGKVAQWYLDGHIGLVDKYFEVGGSFKLFKGVSFQVQCAPQKDTICSKQLLDMGLGIRGVFFNKALVGIGYTANLTLISSVKRWVGHELTVDGLLPHVKASVVLRAVSAYSSNWPDGSAIHFSRLKFEVGTSALPNCLSENVCFKDTVVELDIKKGSKRPTLAFRRFWFCPKLLGQYLHIGLGFELDAKKSLDPRDRVIIKVGLSRYKPAVYACNHASQRDQAKFCKFLTTCKRSLGHSSLRSQPRRLKQIPKAVTVKERFNLGDIASCRQFTCFEGEIGAEANFKMGFMYASGKCCLEKNHEKAISYYTKASHLGSIFGAKANCELGYAYYCKQLGLEQNFEKALIYYQKAANFGGEVGVEAHYMLGYMYQFGDRRKLKQDFKKAVEHYQAAADFVGECGRNANVVLGQAYRYATLGLERNLGKALTYYENAAEACRYAELEEPSVRADHANKIKSAIDEIRSEQKQQSAE